MSMVPAPQSPIPPALKELLALFEGPLAGVSFPDVDGAALQEHAAAVDEAANDVEVAAAAWAAAKRSVDERMAALLHKAQRALSYARIYAEDKPELQASLSAIALAPAPDGRAKAPMPELVPARKRGRPRKVAAAEAPAEEPVVALLSEPPAEAAAAE